MQMLDEKYYWRLGSVEVSNPYRLKEALSIIATSALVGRIVGEYKEYWLACKLIEAQIVLWDGLNEDVAALAWKQNYELGQSKRELAAVGRKWRSALEELGFITPKLTATVEDGDVDPKLKRIGASVTGLKGRPYEVTPQGWRLLNAKTVVEEQECLLRALIGCQLKPAVSSSSKEAFNPLRVVLRIIEQLEEKEKEPSIDFEEMAFVVQFVISEVEIEKVVDAIIEYREKRARASNKEVFDRNFRSSHTKTSDHIKLQTIGDYADINLRYLKATGLFVSSKGQGITLVDKKRPLAVKILSTPFIPREPKDYYPILWNGASLPTDDRAEAIAAIKSLVQSLQDKGVTVSLPELNSSAIKDSS